MNNSPTPETPDRHDYHMAKVIGAVGVNAAYLNAGEFAVSLGHSFCALVVLTNGRESFVAHLSHVPDETTLGNALKDIAAQMGGHVTATLCQRTVGDPLSSSVDKRRITEYAHALEKAVGKENVTVNDVDFETAKTVGEFFITASGTIDPLTAHGHVQLERAFLKNGETFAALHQQQMQQTSEPASVLFHYSDAPAFHTRAPASSSPCAPSAELLHQGMVKEPQRNILQSAPSLR